ncbi:MAG: hypothetical protein EKK53_13530 [Burkholderiales bacterium]|jgi:hypothetical protein|nr:MAG: hypothetical protein EKK53_13530 [Burkholderiales bacterium]
MDKLCASFSNRGATVALTADAVVLGTPRDSARAAAIVKLARDHVGDIGLPPRMQGALLAR